MFVLRMWADTSKLWKYVYNILRANFLNNQQAIRCDKEVLKSLAIKMSSIILQTAKEVFPSLKESLVSVLQRTVIY